MTHKRPKHLVYQQYFGGTNAGVLGIRHHLERRLDA